MIWSRASRSVCASRSFCAVTAATLKGFLPSELQAFKLELEKQLRNVRAEVPPQDDALAQQARNHRIGRLTSALQVVNNQLFSR